jgi:hypothetical protein
MSYGEAEVALLKTRAGPHYERLQRAENEAAEALSAALCQTERHHIRAYAATRLPKVHALVPAGPMKAIMLLRFQSTLNGFRI